MCLKLMESVEIKDLITKLDTHFKIKMYPLQIGKEITSNMCLEQPTHH